MATYYIDTNDFTTATSIWTNSNLTVKAADGFYQKDGFYRQMSGGELLVSTICPSCLIPCGETIITSGAQGIYYLSVELGASTGAVIIEFNPDNVPDGILATYNSVNYNGLSSPLFGWQQGTAGLPTYIGSSAATCNIIAGSPYTLNEFEYKGTTFVPSGTTTIVSVISGQIKLTPSGPGNCIMVIPKTLASPSDLHLSIIGPCTGTVFNLSISCPTALPSFASSTVNASSALACSASISPTYYVAHVTGAAGVLGTHDLVFSDANGQFKLGAGYYKTTAAGSNNWYQVDTNGVIVAFGVCSPPPVVSYNCVSGNCIDPGDGTGTYSTLEACEAVCSEPPVPVWYELSKCSDSSVLYSEEYFQGDFVINERVTIPGSIVCIVVAELLSPPVGALYLIATTGQTGCPPPPPVSYNCVSGNCVDPGDGTGTYATLEACEAVCGEPPAEINVISVSGYMESCSGGSIENYMGALVVLDDVVDVDTEFVIEVSYVNAGGTCGGTQFSQTLNVVIPNGSVRSNFNACTEGVYFLEGAVICGACISSCDNPSVNTTGFDCSL
jgi:hypothetical protein